MIARNILLQQKLDTCTRCKKPVRIKTFIPAPPNNSCACKRLSTYEIKYIRKLYLCMEYETPEITMDEKLREAAKKPIERCWK
jgi:quinolinate synthase